MLHVKTLGVITALAMSSVLLAGKPQLPAASKAEAAGTTPGQLTILDKQGQEVGVCPLKHTNVSADIAGYVSRVTVEQEFGNPTSQAIEAVYTFPLPSDAAVDEMTMLIGKRVVKGQILRKEEARQVYDEAKAQGKAAALLDQERPNIFTQSVANIPPGERVVITIKYVNLLKYEDGVYEFTFPMVVGPRFVGNSNAPGPHAPNQVPTATKHEPVVLTDADRITPPITPKGTRAGHDISVSVRLDAGIPLTDMKAVMHDVDIRRTGPTSALIKLRSEAEIPNRDFILRYTAAGSDVQSGILTYAPGGQKGAGGYFTLILQPPMAPPQEMITPKEMIFVIDQTGSQQGLPIAKAKETMRYCIHNLNPGDTFQLIGFNTQVYPCFPAPVPANQETIAQALKFMEPLEGNGGTDILNSVAYSLKIPDDPDRVRIVCYMTDGYVGNDMQIIDYIGKNRGHARMFPFGVGSSVNRFLIDGMAREGKGQADYVTLQEPGEAAAAKFYKRVASPLLRDIEVDWNGLPVADVYPKYIPDVFSSTPIVLKGRFTGPGEGLVTVRGLLRGKPWSRSMQVTLPATATTHPALATLWAREKIEDLQNQDWMGAQMQQPNPKITDQIIATALEYRLMSQYTSFVAVEERVVNLGGKPRRIDVPVEMPQGVSYEGIFGESEVLAQQAAGTTTLSRNYTYLGAAAGKPQAASAARTHFSIGHADTGRAYGGIGGAGGMGGMNGSMAKAPASSSGASLGTGLITALKAPALSEAAPAGAHVLFSNLVWPKQNDALKAAREGRVNTAFAKLSSALQKRCADLTKVLRTNKSAGVAKIDVQVAVSSLSAADLKKLNAAGFVLTATLRPGRLLLGTIAVGKLTTLAQLPFVVYVDQPKFK